ncbi:hypothetical protein [Haloarcula litorea]|uniref:hypothetical protein n=1 Tax=Haloarcula litorea TaxID=3032579 RepID=UPI0023E8F94A|nr:hypothetical protein [Halomicroarcula sp. GDY20]
MTSVSNSRSVRDLLLVVVFQLGVGLVLVADAANAARGYGTLLGDVGQLVGGLTALGALLVLAAGSAPSESAEPAE